MGRDTMTIMGTTKKEWTEYEKRRDQFDPACFVYSSLYECHLWLGAGFSPA